jgi:hypothetical protein
MDIACITRVHKDQEEHDFFIKQNNNAELFVVDENCFRVKCCLWVFKGIIKFSLIQIKAENDSKFKIRVSVDGGILLIDSAQLDLFEQEAFHV